jgi:hypothetical protein
MFMAITPVTIVTIPIQWFRRSVSEKTHTPITAVAAVPTPDLHAHTRVSPAARRERSGAQPVLELDARSDAWGRTR